MYYIAFTLGFFGSLHCIGMCGPLALGVLSSRNQSGFSGFLSSLNYNFGRTLSYMMIGFLLGILGSVVSFGGFQKGLSICLGVMLILMFLFSVNPDRLIARQPFLMKIYAKIGNTLSMLLKKSEKIHTINLGIINGFLPCGLVYLAAAGATSLGNIWGSTGFMFFFGLGTMPAMIGITLAHKALSPAFRMSLKKLYPIITLILGVYLIYRGAMSKMPLELNFFEALKNPVMCH